MKRSAGTKRAGVAAAGLSTASVSGTNLVRVTRVNCDAEWGRGGPGVRRARGARSGGPERAAADWWRGRPPTPRAREPGCPPPGAPARDWHLSLEAGDEAEVRHDGGFWHVRILQRLPQAKKKAARYEVGAVGYAVEHTVDARALRPRTAG